MHFTKVKCPPGLQKITCLKNKFMRYLCGYVIIFIPFSLFCFLVYMIVDSCFTQLQESDLQENQWIHLYAEFAFHFRWLGYGVGFFFYHLMWFSLGLAKTSLCVFAEWVDVISTTGVQEGDYTN